MSDRCDRQMRIYCILDVFVIVKEVGLDTRSVFVEQCHKVSSAAVSIM